MNNELTIIENDIIAGLENICEFITKIETVETSDSIERSCIEGMLFVARNEKFSLEHYLRMIKMLKELAEW